MKRHSSGSPSKAAALVGCVALLAVACQNGHSGGAYRYSESPVVDQPPTPGTEAYSQWQENTWQTAQTAPLSTFSIDVDRAAYAQVRRFLLEGQLPPTEAVRLEELVNYFDYGYPGPTQGSPFATHFALTECPWAPDHLVARIGLQAKRLDAEALPPANLVFLIDVSGSMDQPNKLPLVKQSLALLVGQLRPQDRIGIVVYAGQSGTVLESTPGAAKQTILEALNGLGAGGGTAGGEGLLAAYQMAEANAKTGSVSRVILCTDGDFNVGPASTEELEALVATKRASGVALTVLGFGTGNYKDNLMETLADKGNGNYAYIDNLFEAQKSLVAELGGTLYTVAKDVKLQVEFNPTYVAQYRLLGYETRLLSEDEFDADSIDAGEIGVGHSVTALYEIVPVGVAADAPTTNSLRYQANQPTPAARASGELLHLKVRYKAPTGTRSELLTFPLEYQAEPFARVDTDTRWALAVTEASLVLRQSQFKGTASLAHALDVAKASRGEDPDGYRAEFVRLLELAQALQKPAPVN